LEIAFLWLYYFGMKTKSSKNDDLPDPDVISQEFVKDPEALGIDHQVFYAGWRTFQATEDGLRQDHFDNSAGAQSGETSRRGATLTQNY
jgi:hypothetical protein